MALKQLPFLAHLQDRDTIFYEIIYSLDTRKIQSGTVLMNQGNPITEIYIVEHGIVEVIGNISGREIVLERLFRGSVINYKNVFMSTSSNPTLSQVTLRFASESVIKTLSLASLNEIRGRDKDLNKAVQRFNLKVAKLPVAPLDYILVLPKKVYSRLLEKTREKMLFGKQDQLMESL